MLVTNRNVIWCVLKISLQLNFEERDKNHLSIQPALAYEDVSWVESSAKLRVAARQWQTAFWSVCHTKTLQGTISMLIQQQKLAANVGKIGAVKMKILPFP